MEKFLEEINKATKGAFPNSISKYKSVHALLLSWKDDDLGVDRNIGKLETLLKDGYGYNVERWQIPWDRPDFELTCKLLSFRSNHETKEQGGRLFIIYYAGHGYLDRARRTMWSCHDSSEQPEGPSVNWHAQEALFTETIHDTLFLFDCCAAGSSSETTRTGIKEVIAACGFETWAPGDQKHSFTAALINVLETMVRGGPFTVANLHQRILENLKHWSPHIEPDELLKTGSDGRLSDIERRKTPVHIALNQKIYYYHSSIQLVGQLAGSTNSYKRTEESLAQWNDKKKEEYTDVIISIRVQGDLDVDQFAHWIRSVPLLALSIQVHSIVHRNPTLVLLALPVAVWDLLPADTPCQFIGYANSPNLIFGREDRFSPSYEKYLHTEKYLEGIAGRPDLTTVREWLYRDYFRELEKSDPDSPYVKYAANMQKLHIGHALWEPLSSATVRLGACGYLSGGKWLPIALPDMPQSVNSGASDQLHPKPSGTWSFQPSMVARGKSYLYSQGNGWGAIFLPSRPISSKNIESDELLIWVHSNAQIILTQYPDVKQYGFYLISGIFTTKNFQIITRNAPAGGSFSIKQNGQGNNMSWSFDSDKAMECKKYQEEAVISFQGFHFTYKKILIKRPTTHIVEEQSATNTPNLYEFQYTSFIWPGNLKEEWERATW